MGRKPATVHGMVLVDKPTGVTSHDVVDQLRKRFGERRIGHAGTLDPDATGLLVVGVGKATRLLRFATASFKTYEVEIVLGIETDTLDSSGQVVAEHRMSPEPTEVVEAASALTGTIEQIPPMVSARRIGGRRLHELAREGIEVDREARSVQIRKFDIRPTDDPMIWRAVVDCSAGTYIRTLGADLGIALEGGAHIRNLRRTKSGGFGIRECDKISEATLRPVLELVRDLDRVVLTDQEMSVVRNGGRLVNERTEGVGPWALTDSSSNLIAVHEKVDGQVVVGVVLPE